VYLAAGNAPKKIKWQTGFSVFLPHAEITFLFYWCSKNKTAAQQSVHLTLGILYESQAVSYALAFFWLDGFAVPALVVEPVETQRRYPLSGTMAQTVGTPLAKRKLQ